MIPQEDLPHLSDWLLMSCAVPVLLGQMQVNFRQQRQGEREMQVPCQVLRWCLTGDSDPVISSQGMCRPQLFKTWHNKYFQTEICSQQLAFKECFSSRTDSCSSWSKTQARKTCLCHGKTLSSCKGLSVKPFLNNKLLKSMFIKNQYGHYPIPWISSTATRCESEKCCCVPFKHGWRNPAEQQTCQTAMYCTCLLFYILTSIQNSHCDPSMPQI